MRLTWSLGLVLLLMIALVPFVSASYTSQYPPEYTSTYVKSYSSYSNYYPYEATDPSNPLDGAGAGTQWMSAADGTNDRQFNIDLGSAKVIKRVYYENFHISGATTNRGLKDITFWGSNSEEAFQITTYDTTDWVNLTIDDYQMDAHSGSNAADPKYIYVTNSNAYRYYSVKYTSDWGDNNYYGLRRIELQTEDVSAPVAAFSANDTSGYSPLDVGFTDSSTNTPTNWDWYWGADETKSSDDQNPTHQFTTGTYNIRLWVSNSGGGDWENKTAYIEVEDAPTPPVAAFSANATSGYSPLDVGFTDSSTNTPTNWDWYWGADETKSSDDQNPTHQFTTGTYNIRLWASNDDGGDWENKTAYIEVEDEPPEVIPVASFTSTNTEAWRISGTTVVFTDTSTNIPTAWNWSFGDGTYSDSQNPFHVYTTSDTDGMQKFTVVLNASNGAGYDLETKIDHVWIYRVPIGNFTYSNNVGVAPLNVSFTDTSQYATLVAWDYTNDGTWDSPEVALGSTVYKLYSTPGIYSVDIRARNGVTSDEDSVKVNIIVVNMNANFTAIPLTGDEDLTVQFNDTSIGSPTSWYWDFGDGFASVLQNPSHTYTISGLYDVNLTIHRSGVNDDYELKTDYINVSLSAPSNASWESSMPSGDAHVDFLSYNLVTFIPIWENGEPDEFFWEITGGEFLGEPLTGVWNSTDEEPDVGFQYPGTYLVNLTITNELGTDTYSAEYVVNAYEPNIYDIGVIGGASGTLYNPATILLYAEYKDDIYESWYTYEYFWDFGDGTPITSTGTSNSITHTYTESGTFNITCNATNPWGWRSHTFPYEVLLTPDQLSTVVRWSNVGGTTVSSVFAGEPVYFAYDTVNIGTNPPIGYYNDYFNIEAYIWDERTDTWIFWKELEIYDEVYGSGVMSGVAAYRIYYSDGTGEKRHNGYGFLGGDSGANKIRAILKGHLISGYYDPYSYAYADITILEKPLQPTVVGDWAKDFAGEGFRLILAGLLVIIIAGIPFAITRVFNPLVEGLAIILAIGLCFFANLLDSWVIFGLGVITILLIFFMHRGSAEQSEQGGEM